MIQYRLGLPLPVRPLAATPKNLHILRVRGNSTEPR